jgi:hypothetical protein
LVLAGEREHIRLSGGAVAEVLPLLDGTRGPDELVAALDERAPREVYYGQAVARLVAVTPLPSPRGGSGRSQFVLQR